MASKYINLIKVDSFFGSEVSRHPEGLHFSGLSFHGLRFRSYDVFLFTKLSFFILCLVCNLSLAKNCSYVFSFFLLLL